MFFGYIINYTIFKLKAPGIPVFTHLGSDQAQYWLTSVKRPGKIDTHKIYGSQKRQREIDNKLPKQFVEMDDRTGIRRYRKKKSYSALQMTGELWRAIITYFLKGHNT